MKMKTKSLSLIAPAKVFAGVLSLILCASLAHADTFTWTKLVSGSGSGSWTNQADWSGGTLPTTTSDTANFSTLNITAASTVTLDADQSINALIFGDNTTASHDWTLAAGTPSTSILTLDGTAPEIRVTNRTAIISAKLAGSVNWTKTGIGTLRLAPASSNTNSFSGGLTISNGIVDARQNFSKLTGLGAPDNIVTIYSDGTLTTGGQLKLNGNGTSGLNALQPIVIQGPGESGANTKPALLANGFYTIQTNNGTITLDGTDTYRIQSFQDKMFVINGGIARSGANVGTLIFDIGDFKNTNNHQIIVNGQINNNEGPVIFQSQQETLATFVLNTNGNNMGACTIKQNFSFPISEFTNSILRLGINDALTTNQDLTLNAGTFDLAGYSQTLNTLSVANAWVITNSAATASTLTFGQGDGNFTLSSTTGVMRDGVASGGGALSVAKVGAGTAILNSSTTNLAFSGSVTVNGGILQLNGAYTCTGPNTVNGGTLYLNATKMLNPITNNIASGGILLLNLNNQTTNMTFNGDGTLQTALAVFNVPRVATYALGADALIDVTGSLWVNQSSVWTDNLSDMTVAGNLYTAFGNVRVDALTGSGTVNLSPGFPGVDDFGLTVGVNNGSGQFDGATVDYAGSGSLSKAGTGTQILTGANDHSGRTAVLGGTLALSGSATLPNSPLISVTNGATFDVSGLSSTFVLGASQTLSNNAASTGNLAGNLDASSGTISVSFTNGTPAFVITNGALTLSAATVFGVTNTGAQLTSGTYPLITKATGGSVAGAVPSVTVGGAGAAGAASLEISGDELNLVIASSQPNPTNITYTVSGSQLVLDWPAGQGWNLQAQTNALATGLTTDWVTVSNAVPPFTNDISPANPAVFYRLKY